MPGEQYIIRTKEAVRHFTKACNGKWYYRARYWRIRYGIDKGLSKRTKWMLHEAKIEVLDPDQIMTPWGVAYLSPEKTKVLTKNEIVKHRTNPRPSVDPS